MSNGTHLYNSLTKIILATYHGFSSLGVSWLHWGIKFKRPGFSDILVTAQKLALQKQTRNKKKFWFVMFANFHSVNNHTMATFKLPMWYHWMQNWEVMCSSTPLCSVSNLQIKWMQMTSRAQSGIGQGQTVNTLVSCCRPYNLCHNHSTSPF